MGNKFYIGHGITGYEPDGKIRGWYVCDRTKIGSVESALAAMGIETVTSTAIYCDDLGDDAAANQAKLDIATESARKINEARVTEYAVGPQQG